MPGSSQQQAGQKLTRHVWQRPPSKRGWKDTGFFLPQDKQLSVRHIQLVQPNLHKPLKHWVQVFLNMHTNLVGIKDLTLMLFKRAALSNQVMCLPSHTDNVG